MRFLNLVCCGIFMVTGASALAGTWSRLDSETIKFEGTIDSNADLEGLEHILHAGDKVLIVNSGGGRADLGVQMGVRLAPLKMKVIVDGICASSCANYLFTAGEEKEIKRGMVGYHGNITASAGSGWAEQVRELKQQGLSDADIAQYHQRLLELAPGEQAYLAAVGVSQALFERSQRADKGMGDGKSYSLLLPTIATFEKYGIKHVTGEQDLAFCTYQGVSYCAID